MKKRAKKLAVLMLAGTLVLSGVTQTIPVNAEEISDIQTEEVSDPATQEEEKKEGAEDAADESDKDAAREDEQKVEADASKKGAKKNYSSK